MKNLFKRLGIVFPVMAIVLTVAACSNSTNADTLTTTSAGSTLAGNTPSGTNLDGDSEDKDDGYGLCRY